MTANRILAREGVVDSFGHASIRHPERPDHYILSRARAPECIEAEDLMEFTADGTPVDAEAASPTPSASSTARSTRRGRTSAPLSTITARA